MTASEMLRSPLLSKVALVPPGTDRAVLPDTDRRPGDLLIPNWTGGRDTAQDVSVVNPS